MVFLTACELIEEIMETRYLNFYQYCVADFLVMTYTVCADGTIYLFQHLKKKGKQLVLPEV